MKARTYTLTIFFLVALLLAAADSFAANLVVTKTGDTADGVCDADCSLREAIGAAAVSGDEIVFSPLFSSSQTIVLQLGQIEFAKSLSITGPGRELLSISGNNSSRIFAISGEAEVSISGLRLRNGRQPPVGEYRGGAIYIINSALYLTNVVMNNNISLYQTVPPDPPASFGSGGAIYSDHSGVALINCEIYANQSPSGAGITTILGALEIKRSTFRDNLGAAVFSSFQNAVDIDDSFFINNIGPGITGSGTMSVRNSVVKGNKRGISNQFSPDVLTIERCIISDNNYTEGLSLSGGGVTNHGTASIRSTVISNNRASSGGGGVFNGGVMHINDSAVIGNSAFSYGGGILTGVGQLFLTNSTVSDNIALKGGGIYNLNDSASPGGRVYLTNTTVGSNRATVGMGGGLLQDAPGEAYVGNSVFANNISASTGPDVSGGVISQGFNLIRTPTGSSGWLGSDLVNQDPKLAALGSNGGSTFTHALRPGSPAINAGSNSLAVDPFTTLSLKTDQRGRPRMIGGVVDIGAYEADYATTPVQVSGRVLTTGGRGLGGSRVTLTNESGVIIYAIVNPAGYFRFINLTPGMSYTIRAANKVFVSSTPQLLTIDQDRDDLIFLCSL